MNILFWKTPVKQAPVVEAKPVPAERKQVWYFWAGRSRMKYVDTKTYDELLRMLDTSPDAGQWVSARLELYEESV